MGKGGVEIEVQPGVSEEPDKTGRMGGAPGPRSSNGEDVAQVLALDVEKK
jgi:hypothetical protein